MCLMFASDAKPTHTNSKRVLNELGAEALGPVSEEARAHTTILGVLREGQPLYYAMFAFQQIMGTGFVAYYLHVSDDPWLERVSTAILYQAAVSVASAGNSVGIIEVARGVIMLAKILEEKVLIPMQERRREREAKAQEVARQEGLQEGLHEGRQEGRPGRPPGRPSGRPPGRPPGRPGGIARSHEGLGRRPPGGGPCDSRSPYSGR